jgi:uncharacterized protein (TIGR00725 family)
MKKRPDIGIPFFPFSVNFKLGGEKLDSKLVNAKAKISSNISNESIVEQKIGVVGPNDAMCNCELFDFGIKLGKTLSQKNRIFICGGMGGFMESFCKGVKSSANTFFGQTIGILPSDNKDDANEFIDVSIPTGIGIMRNVMIIQTSDIIIACGGGAGTLSEIAIAWQLGKKVLCITNFDGWAKELAGKNLDIRHNSLLIPVKTIEEIERILTK